MLGASSYKGDPNEPVVNVNEYALGPGTLNALPQGVDVKALDASNAQSTFGIFVQELVKQTLDDAVREESLPEFIRIPLTENVYCSPEPAGDMEALEAECLSRNKEVVRDTWSDMTVTYTFGNERVTLDGDTLKVQIGSTPHPMTPDHLIEWVYVVTEEGVIAQCLTEDDAPAVEINLAGQVPTAVFSYCNLHGLWKTDL